ncbi:MAG: VacJ family lipoprotein [Candidimonas sp.]|nr:MAG: VacJ family lipoprotein [Candidimonas sp.]
MTRPSPVTARRAPPVTARRLARLVPILAATLLAAGCATVKNPSPNDPWESYNRGMYAFNTKVDAVVFKPIATGYEKVTPKPVRTCIHNMFNNVADLWSAFNSFIQGRGVDFANTLGRVLLNTTMGIGGCFDVNSAIGGRRIVNDFGITLGVWGLSPGPYFVLPILGPSTVRDSAATATTAAATFSNDSKFFSPLAPIMAIRNIPLRNGVLVLNVVDARASLLDSEKLLDQIALDKYSFIRDAYLQRRHALVQSKLRNGHEDALPDYSDSPNSSSPPLPGHPKPTNPSGPSLPNYSDPGDVGNSAQSSYSGVVPVSVQQAGTPSAAR